MALAGLAARRLAPAAASAAAATSSCRRLPALCRAVGSRAVKPPEPGGRRVERTLSDLPAAACNIAAPHQPARPDLHQHRPPRPPLPTHPAPHAETAYCFERAPDEPPAFPELLQPGRRVVLLAVDPDLGGAVAALSWRNPPAAAAAATDAHLDDGSSSSSRNENSSSISSSSNESSNGGGSNSSEAPPLPLQQQGLPSLPLLEAVHVELHDMPIEVWKYGSRDKRQPEAAGLIRILQRYLGAPGAGCVGDGGIGSISSVESSSVKKKRSSKAAGSKSKRAVVAPAIVEAVPMQQTAAGTSGADQQQQQQEGVEKEEPALVHAVVEYSLPPAVSGKFAWYGIGFAVGLLNGLLVGQGITYRRVPCEWLNRACWDGCGSVDAAGVLGQAEGPACPLPPSAPLPHSPAPDRTAPIVPACTGIVCLCAASTWKQQMGLKKQGKEGSIALARHLLPTAAGMLKCAWGWAWVHAALLLMLAMLG